MVAGGPHVTIMPDTVIDKVDVAVIGEGEVTFTEVVKSFPSGDISNIEGIWYTKNGNVYKNPRRNNTRSLDVLPFPALDLLDMQRYLDNWFYLN